ncbi:MAG: response regulator transcription factor [Chloroflexi bacterium]|nr:response regulator transcription factor [Chloroflexota bacterium]
MAKLLIVDDEPALRETLQYGLARQGYEVHVAEDGPGGLQAARALAPDLIVLDVMLPGMDGLEVCRVLRRESDVPILMLTARADEIDRVVGLEVGADDYLVKPFGMRELEARIKALLRRARLSAGATTPTDTPGSDGPSVQTSPPLTHGDLVIDTTRHEVRRRGQVIELKPKEYELLLFLARNRGIVLSRDLIIERVWGWEYAGATRTVDVHIRWLREKIETDPAAPERIITVRGIGYRFEG